MSNLKKNINHLHFLLSEKFSNVQVEERSNKIYGNYFLITITESQVCKIIISKERLESQIFEWVYYANPLDELSTLVERKSSIDNLSFDIEDIFNKKRFDEEYLSSIK